MFNSVSLHGGIFICINIEMFINNIIFKWSHLYVVYLVGFCYTIVNVIVTLSSGPVYSVLDWKSLKSYLFYLASIILTFGYFWFGKIFSERIKNVEPV